MRMVAAVVELKLGLDENWGEVAHPGKGNLGHAVGSRTPESEMVEDDGRDGDKPQQVKGLYTRGFRFRWQRHSFTGEVVRIAIEARLDERLL